MVSDTSKDCKDYTVCKKVTFMYSVGGTVVSFNDPPNIGKLFLCIRSYVLNQNTETGYKVPEFITSISFNGATYSDIYKEINTNGWNIYSSSESVLCLDHSELGIYIEVPMPDSVIKDLFDTILNCRAGSCFIKRL